MAALGSVQASTTEEPRHSSQGSYDSWTDPPEGRQRMKEQIDLDLTSTRSVFDDNWIFTDCASEYSSAHSNSFLSNQSLQSPSSPSLPPSGSRASSTRFKRASSVRSPRSTRSEHGHTTEKSSTGVLSPFVLDEFVDAPPQQRSGQSSSSDVVVAGAASILRRLKNVRRAEEDMQLVDIPTPENVPDNSDTRDNSVLTEFVFCDYDSQQATTQRLPTSAGKWPLNKASAAVPPVLQARLQAARLIEDGHDISSNASVDSDSPGSTRKDSFLSVAEGATEAYREDVMWFPSPSSPSSPKAKGSPFRRNHALPAASTSSPVISDTGSD